MSKNRDYNPLPDIGDSDIGVLSQSVTIRETPISGPELCIWILATYDVVRHVRCRTSCTYDIVRATYDIVLNIARTMSYVRYTGSRRTTSYVRHRTLRTMSHVNIRHRTAHILHRTCSSQHIVTVYNVVCQKWTYDVVCT